MVADNLVDALASFLHRHKVGEYAYMDNHKLAVHLVEHIEQVRLERAYGKLTKVINDSYDTIGYE